jgi:peptide/nickel transport system substrate-binding protein
MGNRRRLVGAALALVLALVAAACGDDGGGGGDAAERDQDATGGDAAAGDETCTRERAGGSVTMGTLSLTASLDPTRSNGTGSAGGHELAAVYDTLMRWDPDRGTWEPHVARSLTPDADFSVWTLELRPDVRFGNGDPLTAAAVKASIERFTAPEATSPRRGQVAQIAEMTVVDDLTLELRLAAPWAGFPYVLADLPGMIVNPDVAAGVGAEEFDAGVRGAGVGPYEPVRAAAGEEIVLQAKDDYWGGPVCIAELSFVNIPGAEPTYEAFELGELQVAFLREPGAIAQAESDGVASYANVVNAGNLFLLNNRPGRPTNDVRVRQAIVAAIDPELIDERVYAGSGKPTSALVHQDSPLFQDLDAPAHDPERARELLAAVQADTGWDGSLTLLCSDTPASNETAIATKALLDAVGFDLRIEHKSAVEQQRQVALDGNYDMACWGTAADQPGTYWGLNIFRSTAPNNFTGYADPAMDAAIARLQQADDLEAQQAALAAMQEAWNETAPSAITGAAEERVVWQPEVHGLVPTQQGMVMFFDAYIES